MSGHIEIFADSLVAGGIRHAFGVTGSGVSLKLIGALTERGVTYHATQTEAAAALMAGAAGWDGTLRAMSVVIKGPGFANALPGLIANRYERRPMVSVSEAYAEDAPQGARHKRLNHNVLTGEACLVHASVSDDGPTLGELITAAQGAPIAGPVHFDLMPNPGKGLRRAQPVPAAPRQGVSPDVLDRMKASRRPALVLGQDARHLMTEDALKGLRIPIATTAAGKGLVDETSAFAAGIVSGEKGRCAPEVTSLAQADLILAIGVSNDEMIAAGALPAPLILADLGDPALREGFGEVAAFAARIEDVTQLLEDLRARDWGADAIASRRRSVEGLFDAEGTSLGAAITALQGLLPPGTVAIPDTGFHCTVTETLWQARTPAQALGASRSRYMGIAIPTAIGRAIADPGRPVLCVFGEGGLAPHFFELSLAVRLRLPILFLYARDRRYGSVAAFAPEAGFVADAIGFDNCRAAQMAASLGCRASRANTVQTMQDALAPLLTGGFGKSGPIFLQYDLDPETYAKAAKELR
ncbi:MAG: acetolactate synthase-1/2/3 large subunit [Afipia broomeae]|jgi:acetolactate synthase-1/2/3 large subunit